MLRPDTDNYLILYIQYKDELHRYAVPRHYSVGWAAAMAIDSMAPSDRKSGEFFRKPGEFFTLASQDFIAARKDSITVFTENETVIVQQVKEA